MLIQERGPPAADGGRGAEAARDRTHDLPALQRVRASHRLRGLPAPSSPLCQRCLESLIVRGSIGASQILFGVEELSLEALDTLRPRVRFRLGDLSCTIDCDFIGGCDGSQGVCRGFVPRALLPSCERAYPFGWFGILVEAPPSSSELIYASHGSGLRWLAALAPVTATHFNATQRCGFKWSDDRTGTRYGRGSRRRWFAEEGLST